MIRRPVAWALDFGAESVVVLAAEQKTPDDWTILGSGEAPARGVLGGEVVKLTDAVEAVVTSIRRAESESGQRCRTLYFNLDDPLMTHTHPHGSKTLAGEGQIQRSDVREAVENAARIAGDYERVPVYEKEIDYVIDGRDSVTNPCGVFGHRLDVYLHVVLCRATHREEWLKVMSRAGFARAIPILSLVSTAAAVLDKKSPKKILWDLGNDLCSGGVIERGLLREYAVFPRGNKSVSELAKSIETQSHLWADSYRITDEMVWTGDGAQGHFPQELMKKSSMPAVCEPILGLGAWTKPQHASVVGLLRVVHDFQKSRLGTSSGKSWLSQAREKASSLVQEYF